MPKDVPVPETTAAVTAGPGAALKTAREARGASVQDVADVLNLTVAVVEDLEAQAWDRLPGPAFTKGYLRAYAKLVDLDGVELVGAYGNEIGDPQTAALGSKLSGAESARFTEMIEKQPGAVLTGAVAAVVVVVALVIWMVWPDTSSVREDVVGRQPPASSPAPSPATSPAASPAAGTRSPATAPSIPIDAAPAGSSAVSKVIESAGQSASEAQVVDDAPALASPPEVQRDADVVEELPDSSLAGEGVDAPQAEAVEPALDDDRLSLLFSEDCWVEVRDATGRNIHSDLGRSGDQLELAGRAPFRVLLGYAPGVELSFNDEPVALAPHTRNNVASLVLGQ